LVGHIERGKTLSLAGRVCLRDVNRVKISDIKEGDNEINIEAEVIEKSYAREVRSKFDYRALMVADATLKDETGIITLTLWNEQVSQVKVGDKVKIEKGYAKSFRDVLQLSTGKSGTLTVIS
jgi:replication factor A1